jgi:preprotein translocase subunit YajC
MDRVTLIRVISGVMFVIVLFLLIQRQKSRSKRG